MLTGSEHVNYSQTVQKVLNGPFARSGLVVQNYTGWAASSTVALPKQRHVKVDWYELLCHAFLYHVTVSCKGPLDQKVEIKGRKLKLTEVQKDEIKCRS